jgi:hypothetical protein
LSGDGTQEGGHERRAGLIHIHFLREASRIRTCASSGPINICISSGAGMSRIRLPCTCATSQRGAAYGVMLPPG